MNIKPYLQLVRLPNLFTAAADSLAGCLLITGGASRSTQWPALVGASVALYAGGVILNDVCDFKVDQVERPGRPLPSGRVSLRLAAALSSAFFAAGLALAAFSGAPNAALVALAIIGTVVAYDAWLKFTAMGPQVMGACRSLNLLLGLSVSAHFGGPAGWLAAVSYGGFVAGITWISRNEAEDATGADPTLWVGLALQNLGLIGHFGAGVAWKPVGSAGSIVFSAVVFMLIALAVNRSGWSAIRDPSGLARQRAVRTGILALVWLHVGLLLAAQGPVPAALVAALWAPAYLTGRWVYST